MCLYNPRAEVKRRNRSCVSITSRGKGGPPANEQVHKKGHMELVQPAG